MFKEEQSPVAEFRGYRVRTFRQLRANLAERTLQGRVLHFVPWKGVVGVFIPAQEYPADAAALEEAWTAAGSPPVHLPGPGEALLFGRILPVRTMPFAGYDDLVEEQDALCVACKRAPDPEDVVGRVEAYRRATLLARAKALLEGWGDRLTRCPADLLVWPRLKHRTLGQCMRTGEIRLNPRLADWPETILEETLAHEVSHLTHFNHSPAFWRTLSTLLPDWLPRSLVHYL